MSRIPEETLQQVLAATDIVDLVGRVVKLRRAGVNWVGLCPFHQEKSPSFNVSPQRGTYHCFGCGAGGNAFRFVMEHDGLSFVEAVKRLADASGIRIEEEVWDANAERAAKERAALMRVHSEIAAWYHSLLMRHPVAAPARDYLKGRGINAATAKSWQMGYAPASGDFLREWALERKFPENVLVTAGILATDEEDGRTYPRFRQRLMFPIRNDYGEVIAFSGRLLDSQAKAAKYLNSPETPIFSKSRVLFGLDRSKRAIIKAGRAIVCEGQIDMITVFEAGFENVVAPLGTAFTEFHARMLKRHADEVVLCFDSDNAGYKAAERAFSILSPTGIVVKIAPLPPGEDPDSLIRGQGPDAFRHHLDDARDFFEHMISFAAANRDLNDTREKTRFAGEMASMIRLLDNPIARDAAIQKVAVRLGLPETDYRRQVARTAKPQAAAREDLHGSPVPAGQPLPPQDKTALLLCRYALSDAAILRWLRETGRQSICADIPGSDLLAIVWQAEASLASPAELMPFLSSLSREEEGAFTKMLAQPMPGGGQHEAAHALEALEVKRLQSLLQRAQTELKQPGLSSDALAQLQQRVLSLRKEYLDRRAALQKVPPLPE